VRRTARQLVHDLGLYGPPYDPWFAAARMAVRVERRALRGIDGCVEARHDGYYAWLATGASPARERFTLAHELGHVLILRAAQDGHPLGLVRYRAGQGERDRLQDDPVEDRLCDVFAAEFLMPTQHIQDEVNAIARARRLGPDAVTRVARIYGVSLTAAAKRIVDVAPRGELGIALWDVNAAWPMPVWWFGLKLRSSVQQLESLAWEGRKTAAVSQLYCRGRGLRAEVAPLNTRYVLMFVGPLAAARREPTQLCAPSRDNMKTDASTERYEIESTAGRSVQLGLFGGPGIYAERIRRPSRRRGIKVRRNGP